MDINAVIENTVAQFVGRNACYYAIAAIGLNILTGFNGQTYDYNAKLRRGEHRVARSQVLRNDQGKVVAARRTVRPRRSPCAARLGR